MVNILDGFYLDGTYQDKDDRYIQWISIGRDFLWLLSIAPKGLWLFSGLPRRIYDLSEDDDALLKIIGVDLI